MEPIILFRKNKGLEEEFEIAKKYFNVVEYRTCIPKDSVVIIKLPRKPRPLAAGMNGQNKYLTNFKYLRRI